MQQPIEPIAAAAADGNGIDMLALMLHASIPVQLVMLLLIFGSIASWPSPSARIHSLRARSRNARYCAW